MDYGHWRLIRAHRIRSGDRLVEESRPVETQDRDVGTKPERGFIRDTRETIPSCTFYFSHSSIRGQSIGDSQSSGNVPRDHSKSRLVKLRRASLMLSQDFS